MTLTDTVSSLAHDVAAAASDFGSQAVDLGRNAADAGMDAASSVANAAAHMAQNLVHNAPIRSHRRRLSPWLIVAIVTAGVATVMVVLRKRRAVSPAAHKDVQSTAEPVGANDGRMDGTKMATTAS